MQALINGLYDQAVSYEELTPYGDFGIGTFTALNGEMIMVDNELYRVTADGVAHLVSRNEGAPFAMVTYFEQVKVTKKGQKTKIALCVRPIKVTALKKTI